MYEVDVDAGLAISVDVAVAISYRVLANPIRTGQGSTVCRSVLSRGNHGHDDNAWDRYWCRWCGVVMMVS